MVSQSQKSMLSFGLAASMLLAPTLAFADGIVRLSPMNSSNSSYSPPSVSGYGYGSERVSLRGHVVSIPVGTQILIRLNQPVTSQISNVGETVTATIENNVAVGSSVMVPAGSEMIGQIVHAEPSGRMGKRGELDLNFHTIRTPDGNTIPLRGHIETGEAADGKKTATVGQPKTVTRRIAEGVGITAGGTGVGAASGVAVGSLLGAVGSGVLFGTAVGGLAGLSYAMLRKGKEATIPSGSRFVVVVDQEVNVNPLD